MPQLSPLNWALLPLFLILTVLAMSAMFWWSTPMKFPKMTSPMSLPKLSSWNWKY